MKKKNVMVIGLVLALSMVMASSAFARWGGGRGLYGCDGPGDCYGPQGRYENRAEVDVESVTKFQKETLKLRDELLTKRLELSREYDKESPDSDRIAELRKEIIDIETGIAKVADKYGIDGGKGRRAGRGSRGAYNCGGPGNCF